MKKKLIVFIIVILVIAGGGLMFYLNKDTVHIKGQTLNSYKYSTGGGMNGGYSLIEISRYDDTHALYTKEHANWYYEDPVVQESLIDIQVLDDINQIVTKQKMNKWNYKTFTKEIIMDGESYTYTFTYDNDKIYFTSQYYPQKYQDKLDLLANAIEPYIANQQKLPGLILPVFESEEDYVSYVTIKDSISLYVSQYSANKLYFKVLNDTTDIVTIDEELTIKKLDDNTVIETKKQYITAYPGMSDAYSISLKNRLDQGLYELTLGDYHCTFEIGITDSNN